MTSPTDKERARLGIKARQDAIKALITKYQAEFDEMVTKNRVAAGLPLRPQGPTKQQLEERIAREEAKLEKWRKQLEEVA